MIGERIRTLVVALVCLVSGFALGDTYIGRLPDHRGFWLVRVRDHVDAPRPSRPQRTVFILVDGLRRDAAETMKSAGRIAARGQCRVADQGSYTVSRPEYALLSTGLEADRTGARNNDLTSPLEVESVWEIARREGLRVRGSSHLPWFQQLFPRGFDAFRYEKAHEENVFAGTSREDGFDIDLFHPLYVDEAGHQHGAASPEYASAVARADAEIAGVLDTLDLEKDLVILTADHGHRDQGGHGGSQPEIRNVLTCFAGLHVTHRDERAPFDGRVTAPLLSVLLGLPFPSQMRAGDDGLDAIWDIVQLDPAYVADRRAAIEEFRQQNRVALEGWLGGPPGTWERLYDRERGAQERRIALVASALAVAFGLSLRRAQRRGAHAAWVAAMLLFLWLAHHAVLGAFDYTVINLRERYVPAAFLVVAIAAVAGVILHYGIHRRLQTITAGFTTLLVLLFLANVGHIFVYGWPLGFPLPPAPARYFPFFGAIAQAGLAIVTALLVMTERRNTNPS